KPHSAINHSGEANSASSAKAINAIPVRIILFYVLALFVVMSVTPWNHIRADKSPFVELFLNAGIPISAIIMNLVVL
ncbi:hypothetical protein ACTXQV_75715, partial [Klebsiella pneumoniae]